MALTKATERMTSGGHVNVLDYGADPTGASDSSSAFQAAIDTLKGAVFVPEGTYKISNQVNYKGNGLIGVGNLKSIINCEYSGVNFKKVVSADFSKISGLRFVGNGTNTCWSDDGGGNGWFRTQIEDLNLVDFDICFEMNNIVFSIMKNCVLVGKRPLVIGGTYANCATFISCIFEVSPRDSNDCVKISPTSPGNGNNLCFIGCSFEDGIDGIDLTNSRISLTECYWEDISDTGVRLDNSRVSVDGGHAIGYTPSTLHMFNADNSSVITEISSVRTIDTWGSEATLANSSRMYALANNQNNVTTDATSSYSSLETLEFPYTPTVYGSSVTGSGTYTVQTGFYREIGDALYLQIDIEWTAHTGSGELRVTIPSGYTFVGNCIQSGVLVEDITFTNTPFLIAYNGQSHLRLNQNISGGSPSTVSLPSAGRIIFTGWFKVLS